MGWEPQWVTAWCEKCRLVARVVDVRRDPSEDGYQVAVKCHGAAETVFIDAREAHSGFAQTGIRCFVQPWRGWEKFVRVPAVKAGRM